MSIRPYITVAAAFALSAAAMTVVNGRLVNSVQTQEARGNAMRSIVAPSVTAIANLIASQGAPSPTGATSNPAQFLRAMKIFFSGEATDQEDTRSVCGFVSSEASLLATGNVAACECSTVACRVEFDHPDADRTAFLKSMLPRLSQQFSRGAIDSSQGPTRSVVYFARNHVTALSAGRDG